MQQRRVLTLGFALIGAVVATPAADFTGRWRAEFNGPPEERPKTVAYIDFDFTAPAGAKSGEVTGTVEAGNWPGRAPLAQGRIDGDRISFVAVGKLPWTMKSRETAASGLPRLSFSGKLQPSGKLTIRLVWDSVMLYGPWQGEQVYELTAVRLASPAPPDL